VRQKIEGQNLQVFKKGTSLAETFTLAFWVKSHVTGTYTCELEDKDNSRSVSKSYTVSSANTWEKKVINFPADTSGAFGNVFLVEHYKRLGIARQQQNRLLVVK
jgi:hypothetical protein